MKKAWYYKTVCYICLDIHHTPNEPFTLLLTNNHVLRTN